MPVLKDIELAALCDIVADDASVHKAIRDKAARLKEEWSVLLSKERVADKTLDAKKEALRIRMLDLLILITPYEGSVQ
jgi:hypothetical protein